MDHLSISQILSLASVEKANLVMKVTDLAGRTRVVAAVHDFNSHGGDR